MKKWFKNYIGCSFTIFIQNEPEECVFCGTCENPNTKSGKPLQYYFEGEKHGSIILPYKDARAAMGAMIDKYSRRKGERI